MFLPLYSFLLDFFALQWTVCKTDRKKKKTEDSFAHPSVMTRVNLGIILSRIFELIFELPWGKRGKRREREREERIENG